MSDAIWLLLIVSAFCGYFGISAMLAHHVGEALRRYEKRWWPGLPAEHSRGRNARAMAIHLNAAAAARRLR